MITLKNSKLNVLIATISNEIHVSSIFENALYRWIWLVEEEWTLRILIYGNNGHALLLTFNHKLP